MNNPIAFADEYGAVIPASHKYFTPEIFKDYTIPLIELKELTDEEIESVLTPFVMAQFQLNKPSPQFDYLGFAKAILRKAQEK